MLMKGGRRGADKVRRIAANAAKLPEASGLNSLVGRSGLNRQPPRSNFLVSTASATLYPLSYARILNFMHASDFPS